MYRVVGRLVLIELLFSPTMCVSLKTSDCPWHGAAVPEIWRERVLWILDMKMEML